MLPQASNFLRPFLNSGHPGARVPYFLVPFLQGQNRSSSILSSLSDNPGAYSHRIRRGRGPSSGRGKTSGRGQKGQKARGKVPRDFNGGQTPDEVVHGIRGDHNYDNFSLDMKSLNLYKIQDWVDQGRLDPTKPITIKELCESRCVSNLKDGVKLLAKGSEELRTPLDIIVSRASAKAISSIEAAGGSIITRYYTSFALKRILQGRMDPINSLQAKISAGEETAKRTFRNRLPDPTSRKDIEYYRDPAHRGYLSHLVPEGHGPSLFFKTPGAKRAIEGKTAKSKTAAGENRVW